MDNSMLSSLKTLSGIPMELTGEGVKAIVNVVDKTFSKFWYPTTITTTETELNKPTIEDNNINNINNNNNNNDLSSEIAQFQTYNKSFKELSILELEELYNNYHKLLTLINK
ncbi:hypothetical protein K502DRAFT_143986 [Neoconidiobolus thromboides FSU 785]|nr:hypothetical protein K502DRAFT_143986 [Neoconidiobolus thromboides FSU 785]